MKHPLAAALAVAMAVAAPAFAQDSAMPEKAAIAAHADPFAADSPLPLHYPEFNKIADSDFAPAFDRGMAEQLAEVRKIADNAEPATFDNTIIALEKSGRELDRATSVFFNLVGTDTNPAREKLRAEYAPKFSAHGDAIRLDPKLFARIKSLYDQRASLGLDAQGERLVERYYTDFVRGGANLGDADKARLKDINGQLAKLGT